MEFCPGGSLQDRLSMGPCASPHRHFGSFENDCSSAKVNSPLLFFPCNTNEIGNSRLVSQLGKNALFIQIAKFLAENRSDLPRPQRKDIVEKARRCVGPMSAKL
jgi:hypothetical protein